MCKPNPQHATDGAHTSARHHHTRPPLSRSRGRSLDGVGVRPRRLLGHRRRAVLVANRLEPPIRVVVRSHLDAAARRHLGHIAVGILEEEAVRRRSHRRDGRVRLRRVRRIDAVGRARVGWLEVHLDLQLQRLRVERVLQRVDGPNHLVALELRVVVQVAHAPEERRAVEGRGSPEGARRKALHARGERHVERVRRRVRAPPQHAADRIGQPRARLDNVRVGRAEEADGALPIALDLAPGGATGRMVGRAPRPRGEPNRLIKLGALVIGAHRRCDRRDVHLLIGRRADGVRPRDAPLAVVWLESEGRRQKTVDAPHATARVVLVRVLPVAVDAREVDQAVRGPPPALGERDGVDGRRAEEVGAVSEVDLSDDEDVWDDGNVIVGDALCHPDGRLAGWVGQDVEDKALARVGHEQTLRSALEGPGAVETILLGERPHQLHRLARRRRALHCNL
mmetsp:Transcript_64739/g.193425  ORF Transcript_64739/g.193425 Transcript_64739/m.193425 type:complete len:452 (-) Transcript_64739:162-1517(-)